MDSLVAEIGAGGGEAVALPGDVRSEDYAKALVALASQTFPKARHRLNAPDTNEPPACHPLKANKIIAIMMLANFDLQG